MALNHCDRDESPGIRPFQRGYAARRHTHVSVTRLVKRCFHSRRQTRRNSIHSRRQTERPKSLSLKPGSDGWLSPPWQQKSVLLQAFKRNPSSMAEIGSFVDRVLLRSCPPAGEESTDALPPTTRSSTSSSSTLEACSSPKSDPRDCGNDGECAATVARGRSQQAAALSAEMGGSHERSIEQAEAGLAAMGSGRAMGLKKSGEARLTTDIKALRP